MKRILSIFLLSALISCSEQGDEHQRFIENNKSGIHFTNSLQPAVTLNILNYLYYYNGAGVATGDFDNDGLVDIYFTGNQVADQLYLNIGGLKFKENALVSGIQNASGWTTGVTTVDINHDGLLDIYISKVSGHLNIKGHNLLYINQGIINDQLTFKEAAADYGLDFAGLFTQAAFFDFDLDGDLDMYLMGHSLYPNAYFGRGSQRLRKDEVNGDKFLENQGGNFVDITEKVGILSSRIGYGLGIGISDLNNDGYPDIHIANDFFEDEYLYINEGGVRFRELNSSQNILGHTSHFSMGTDIADINNDGQPDLVTVDMLPENLETLKTSGTEYNYPIFQNQLKQGYQPQFMQNALHLNQGNAHFSEIAFASGIEATEWSWAPLIADFDNDGNKDLFITNGIQGATNDMDFIKFISNDKIQKRLGPNMTDDELKLIKELPIKKTANYFFRNNGNITFTDVTEKWFKNQPSFSNGSSYADLDNDGDLDIIINNVNEPAQILENVTQQQSDSLHYIQVHFRGSDKNSQGIGAKVYTYSNGQIQYYENYTTRGFLSAVPPTVHIGLHKNKVDSLKIVWPRGTYQTIYAPDVNTTLEVSESNSSNTFYTRPENEENTYSIIQDIIDFRHKDNPTLEFDRDPLIPFASSNLSKVVAVGDLNNDGLDDILTLGAKGQETSINIQKSNGSFVTENLPQSEDHSINEDVDAVIFDANGDSLNDILIVSGGNEFQTGKNIAPRIYISDGLKFTYQENAFSNVSMNASRVEAVDYDNDGDLDISISSNTIAKEFGRTSKQYLFENDGAGNFEDVSNDFGSELQDIGNVQDLVWIDIDSNGFKDVVLVGHWMSPSIFLNDGKKLKLQTNNGLSNSNGWYNTLRVADFDKDGDMDIITGNWGLNTRLKASAEKPLNIYIQDFDGNKTLDPIVTYNYKGKETTLATKDELVKQLPYINKEFLSYSAFAKAEISDLFPSEKLRTAEVKKVQELASVYFENQGNTEFIKKELPFMAQVTSVHDILLDDFNEDGYIDALLVGNQYEISTQLGRLDASQGVLLLNDKKGFFNTKTDKGFTIKGASRSAKKIEINGQKFYIIGRNNDNPLFIKKED